MNILLNPDGSRNTDFRPYINMSESKYNVIFYDPNGYNLDSGLYTRNYGVAPTWANYAWQNIGRGTYKPDFHLNQNGQPIRPIPIPGWNPSSPNSPYR